MALLRIRKPDGEIAEIACLPGAKGADGKTPVKGVDYFTAEEQEAFLASAKQYADGLLKSKVYEHIATIIVAADEDGSLPQHVIFSADSEGNAFELTDFAIKCHAGFVNGGASTLYMAVNGDAVIANGSIGSISSSPRGFSIYFRIDNDGFKRIEYTSSVADDTFYNAQAPIQGVRVIPPMISIADPPVTNIDLYTSIGTTQAWVEGSTFELWGVRK